MDRPVCSGKLRNWERGILCAFSVIKDRKPLSRTTHGSNVYCFSRFKIQLVTTIQNEENSVVRKRACEVTALLACKLLNGGAEDNDWKDFPEFIFTWSYSVSSHLRQAAQDIFAAAPGMFVAQPASHPYEQLSRLLLTQGLTDPSQEVKMAALRAVFCYVNHDQSHPTSRAIFTYLLPRILGILVDSLGTEEGGEITRVFLDLAATYPGVLSIHEEFVKQICLNAAAFPYVPDDQRRNVLEIVRKLSQ